MVRVIKKGLEFNGYYASVSERAKYANIREFALIEWEDLDKIRALLFEKKKNTKKRTGGSSKQSNKHVIDKPDEEYLKRLPQVTMNGKKYYLDVERKERRPVDSPEKVFNFEGLPAKKPS